MLSAERQLLTLQHGPAKNTYSQSDGSTSYPRNVFLTQVSDPQGNTLTVNYDSQDRITSLLDATGRSTTFSYQLSSFPLLITQITDPFGRSARLAYDSIGRLSSITDVIGITSSFTYDANSLVDALTTPYGTTQFSYTAPGTSGLPRYVDVTDPLGYHEREEWLEPAPIPDSDPAATVPSGMPLAPTNMYLTYRDSFHWDKAEYVAAGCSVSGGCDYTKATDTHFLHQAGVSQTKSGVIESIKYPLENRIWYQYPGQTDSITTGSFGFPVAAGRVLDDGTSQVTKNSFDTSGFFKLTQTIDPVGRATTYTYANQIDLTGIAQTTANGIHTTIAQYVYNTDHRPIFYTDAAGRTSTYGYDSAGQLTSVTNALSQTTTFAYNSTGDLTTVTNANSITAALYTYDAFDRVQTLEDSEGWLLTYSYDNADRITSVTYPDGTQDRYTYNRLDLASHTDRLGRITTYVYDADRRLTSVTDPTGHQTLFGYNPDGQITSRTDPNTNQTLFAYDIEGRLTTKTYPDTSTLTYVFENTSSRLHTATDALSQVKTYGYTEDSRVSSLTYTGAANPTPNVSFTYDPYFARVVSMSDGTGTTTYAYVPVGSDGALRKQTETTPLASGVISYAYDALGRLSSRTVQGQGAETFAYDAIGRVNQHNSDLGSFALAYLGQTTQLSSRSLASSTLATSFSYRTNLGDRRLSGVSTTGLSSGQYTTFSYASNDGAQVTGTIQTSDATVPYPPNSLLQTVSYNNLNQATAVSGQTYTYDADGNLTSDGVMNYAWDAENRLVGITYVGVSGKATAFTYDGLGRRLTIASTPAGGGSTVTTTYIWCGDQPCQARNSSNTVIKGYYAEGESAPGSPGTPYFYAPDNIGSVRRVFSASSSPTYDYDPYGVPLQATAPVTDFNYAGAFYNADSGLDLAVNRIYNPAIGRWLSRDPAGEIGDPLGNLYAYVGGNPISLTDPEGLLCPPPQVADMLGGLGGRLQADITSLYNQATPEQRMAAVGLAVGAGVILMVSGAGEVAAAATAISASGATAGAVGQLAVGAVDFATGGLIMMEVTTVTGGIGNVFYGVF